jgi:hypothetical protein
MASSSALADSRRDLPRRNFPMKSDQTHRVVYPPLDTLKPIAPDIWIVDSGPLRAMGLPVPVRMTVIRLGSGEILLHSPTCYDYRLGEELGRLGPIRHLVAPNIAHWMFLKDWQAKFPDAETWAAPGLRDRATVKRSGVSIDHDLGRLPPEPWRGELDQIIIPGGLGVKEVAFLHRSTSTLILTDMVQNFEPSKLNALARPLVRLAGAMAPDGMAPAHFRFAINRNRDQAAAQACRLIEWEPKRVIFAHGKWFDRDGTAQLRRSLRWLVD